MKTFIIVAALLGIWMRVDGASIITPDPSMGTQNSSITELQTECIGKISQNDDLMMDLINVKYTFLRTFIRLSQEIRMQNSLDSLDSMINNICYPALDEDNFYSLVMNIARLCLNQNDNFSNEEKQIIKNKLERIFCSLYMKLAAIISFSPDCITSNSSTLNEISKCAAQNNITSEKPFRNWFFANAETCKKQSKILDCVNQAISGQCSAAISSKIESTLLESRSILGCEAEPNSIEVINKL